MELVEEIRRNNGFGPDMQERVANDPGFASFRNKMQGDLEQALKNLSEELYSKSTHFIFEFIQNAEDNTYLPEVVPTLQMRVEDNQMSFHCNEKGFCKENVEAICRVGASTKNHAHGYIGEKGIGFKSVFKVADVVYISSGPYTFKLDKRQKLGMITPIWDSTDHPVILGWTSFYLQLSKSGHDLADRLEDIKPSLLLFLRKLRSLTIEVALSDRKKKKLIEFNRQDTDDIEVVSLQQLVDRRCVLSNRHLMISHSIRAYRNDPRRKNIQESEIILAFPITTNGEPIIEEQEVHAFLPLRKFGFNFIIQADFLTSTSRENILSDSQWNVSLRSGVVDAFLKAVERFKERPALEFVWFRYLPNHISDSFLNPLERQIKLFLRQTPIFRSTNQVYRIPSEILTIPTRFCDEAKLPLIPEQYLPSGMYYLSTDYNVSSDGIRFTDLGVREMSDEHFVQGLRVMQDLFSERPDSWHEAVCKSLFNLTPTQKRKLMPEIKRLCILPLSNNTWVSSSTVRDVFFDLKSADIPGDLGLASLKGGINKTWTFRYRLFEELGVKPADPVLFAGRILLLHATRVYDADDLAALISHAQFMFGNRELRGFPLPTNLKVMDDEGSPANGSELYMDLPRGRRLMRDILPRPPARFIHPDYLKLFEDESTEEWWRWRQWLQDYLNINVAPRIINGELSPEFAAMVRRLESRELLAVLKETWSRLNGELSAKGISQLARTIVICEDGTSQMLNATYIQRKSLMHYHLPFLPIQDPDDLHWDFLKHFGVSTDVNGSFFIKRLFQLQQAGCKDENVIKDSYEQLHARFYDDPEGIREAFLCDPLIFASKDLKTEKKWMSFSDVVWSGPPSMLSKVALKLTYPSLEGFFCQRLKVSNPHFQDLLVEEIKLIVMSWKKKKITDDEVKTRTLDVLFDISALLSVQSTFPEWLEQLSEESIFPVDSTSGDLLLCKLGDEFYVPDNAKYEKMCRGHVPLLALDIARLPSVQSLLDSKIFQPRISYLGSVVKYSSVATGTRMLKPEITQKYSARLDYIERVVRYAMQTSPRADILRHLTSLRNLAICSVASIETTFTVDDFKYKDTDYLAIEEDSTKLSILVSKACHPRKWDLFICARLGGILGIPKDKLQSIVLQPIEAMEDWLALEGVPNLGSDEPSLLHDQSWLQDANDVISPYIPEVETNSSLNDPWQCDPSGAFLQSQSQPTGTSENNESWYFNCPWLPPGTQYPFYHPPGQSQMPEDSNGPELQDTEAPSTPSNNPRTPATTSNQSGYASNRRFSKGKPNPNGGHSKNGSTGMGNQNPATATSVHNFVQRSFMGHSPSESTASHVPMFNSAVQPWTSGGTGFPGVHPDYFGSPQVSQFEQENGVMGEHLVYTIFSRDLPGFGPDNWTSELRAYVPGFTPYEATSLADFRYHDFTGVLTSLWYGMERSETWRDRWPTYHIEVKTTSNLSREAFHMSSRQLETALHLTSRNQYEIPKDVYVILRISGIRSLPASFEVYVDPHCHLNDGGLRIVTDTYLVGR